MLLLLGTTPLHPSWQPCPSSPSAVAMAVAPASGSSARKHWGAAQRAAALPQDTTPQPHQSDPGLESFKALIGNKRFTCTQCGKCCTGDGEVWIADAEATRIAEHLGMPLQRFLQQYVRAYSKVVGFRLLRAKNNATRDCIFLQPDNTCSIHKVRPLQCSTYPWWPDLMNDYDWGWEKENICEGFDHPDAGPTDMDEAARQLKAATAMEYQRMLSRKPSKKQKKAAQPLAALPQPPAPAASSSSSPGSQHGSISSSSRASSQASGDGHSTAQQSVHAWGPGQADHVQPVAQQAQHHSQECSSKQQQQQQHDTEGESAAAHRSRKAASKERWQQRLFNLQQLAESDPHGL